jgi:hypothetical protein
MNLYSLDEANYLVTWYSDKLIGKFMRGKVTDESLETKITHIDIEPYGYDQYSITVFGKVYNQVFYTRRDIELIAAELGLLSPQEVLDKRD